MTLMGTGLAVLKSGVHAGAGEGVCVRRLYPVYGSQFKDTREVRQFGMKSLSHLFAVVDWFSCYSLKCCPQANILPFS